MKLSSERSCGFRKAGIRARHGNEGTEVLIGTQLVNWLVRGYYSLASRARKGILSAGRCTCDTCEVAGFVLPGRDERKIHELANQLTMKTGRIGAVFLSREFEGPSPRGQNRRF